GKKNPAHKAGPSWEEISTINMACARFTSKPYTCPRLLLPYVVRLSPEIAQLGLQRFDLFRHFALAFVDLGTLFDTPGDQRAKLGWRFVFQIAHFGVPFKSSQLASCHDARDVVNPKDRRMLAASRPQEAPVVWVEPESVSTNRPF